MIERAIRTDAQPTRHDRSLTLDERSMRILELGLAGLALAAAILLGVR
jgi:hypothetical protein